MIHALNEAYRRPLLSEQGYNLCSRRDGFVREELGALL
jgi:hypothetical protein